MTAGLVNLAQNIRDVQERRESVCIVYKSHDQWPFAPESYSINRGTNTSGEQDLRISVLDSSFNPPTLAHLALARSKPPSGTTKPESGYDYDARLLLLSVRNADKAAPKSGEATYEERLEMMRLLAEDLGDVSTATEPASSATSGNVAVAIIDEPTFVRKSVVLRQCLQDLIAKLKEARSAGAAISDSDSRAGELVKVQNSQIKLAFIMGFDTLERFLAPRYYNNSLAEMHEALRTFFSPPPEGDGSEIVCAWRGQFKPENVDMRERLLHAKIPVTEEERKVQETLSIAQPFITSGSVSFILLNDNEMMFSSTEVRKKRLECLPDWRAMVPLRVAEYIEEVKLYIHK